VLGTAYLGRVDYSSVSPDLLDPERRIPALVRHVAGLVESGGGRQWASSAAEEHLRAAEAALDRVSLAPGPRGELTALARYLTRRES